MSISSISLPIDEIGIRHIHPSSNPLRSDIGDIDPLCGSIDQVGLLQPIIVRGVGGHFEVVAGNRRLSACRRLGWHKVPCHIVELSDKEAFEVSLIENLDRKTLNPLEEGRAFKDYVGKAGWGGLTELSNRIGRSPSYISKRIKLTSLPPAVLEQIFRRRNSPSLAEELLTLEEDEQLEVARTLEREDLTTREMRRLVNVIKEVSPRGGQRKEESPWKAREARERFIMRCIEQTIAALRLSLSRMDTVLEKLDKEWIEKEVIMQYRLTLHGQIDSLIRLRRKLGLT
ncbi:MAG: ParB/RepB/Spo0J family partition protein [Nitrososphaerota archaeon]|nr:ParB/RepB/Spo0J family partition protein [Nitrososphaerota archaeon]